MPVIKIPDRLPTGAKPHAGGSQKKERGIIMDKDYKVQMAKFNEFLKKEDTKKTIKIVVICLGAILLIAAAGYIVYKHFFAKDDEYDLYDELDFYYEDDEEDDFEEFEETESAGTEADAAPEEA